MADSVAPGTFRDTDPIETEEWIESLAYVLQNGGPDRVRYLLDRLEQEAQKSLGVDIPFSSHTPYINTIPRDKQLPYPGDREIERRIKSLVRWNAMAMVTRANKRSRWHWRSHLHLCIGCHAV